MSSTRPPGVFLALVAVVGFASAAMSPFYLRHAGRSWFTRAALPRLVLRRLQPLLGGAARPAARRQSRPCLAADRGDHRRLGAAGRLQRQAQRARGGLEVRRAHDARPCHRPAGDRGALRRSRLGRLGPRLGSTGRCSPSTRSGLPRQATLVAFVLILVGLASKIGWAPVHNWLPDAHSEAPPPVSAMLSAALLPTVLLIAWRTKLALEPALGAGTVQELFIGFGLASLLVAIPFLWRPLPWKRLLAYSSLEHMGILALGIGFGTPLAIAGVVVHVAGHGLAKALGFYTAIPLLRQDPSTAESAPRGVARTSAPTATAMSVSLVSLCRPAPIAALRLRGDDPAGWNGCRPDRGFLDRRRPARARLPRTRPRPARGPAGGGKAARAGPPARRKRSRCSPARRPWPCSG